MINSEGFKPTPQKVQAITQYPKPRTVNELRRFLGMANFYRRSLRHAAEVQARLHHYLCDSRKNDQRAIIWTKEAEEAFDKIKFDLANAALLNHPASNVETRLITDASDIGIGAALEQRVDQSWKPLSFFSKKFSSA